MKTTFIILVLFIFSSCSNTNNSKVLVEEASFAINDDELIQEEVIIKYALASDTVLFKFHESAQSNILYFNMHDDENTAVGAIESILDCNFNGRFLELIHTGERQVSFKLNNEIFSFDPNRIFTPKGVKASLEKYGNYSEEASVIVQKFGEFIVNKLLKDTKIVVTLHNNSEDNYSIRNYENGEMYENDASEVFVNPKMDSDDFLYVTEENFFNLYKEKGYNVLLQNNETVTDDGSLSVYCGMNGIEYINVEAQHGHLSENIEMIKYTNQVLSDIMYDRYLADSDL